MKKVVKLSEGQLNRIIKESVKNILNESYDCCWYGDVKPFEIIEQMADKIVQSLDRIVNNDGYEEVGDDYSYGRMYEWAKRVRDDASLYIQTNSKYAPINGGEDW